MSNGRFQSFKVARFQCLSGSVHDHVVESDLAILRLENFETLPLCHLRLDILPVILHN